MLHVHGTGGAGTRLLDKRHGAMDIGINLYSEHAHAPCRCPPRAAYWSIETYLQRSGPLLTERGFFEREIGRVEERFGAIVHAFSTYDSRWTAHGEVFQRGINSIQLMHDGTRWWVMNIMWWGVGPEVEIPDRYRGRQ